jgi:filamentous hemagglutinin
MNAQRFRLVFSRRLGMLVPAAEATRSHGGKGRCRRRSIASAVATAVLAFGTANADQIPAHTLPVPVIPIAPDVNIAATGAATAAIANSTLTVNQSTARAIIDWQSFSIGSGGTVNFNHLLGASSATLNRVIGNERSIIEGALNAQGQVYIINANGILFGKDATINVGGLVASALNISNQTFLNGLTSLVAQDESTRPDAAFSWEGSAEKFRDTMVRVDDGALIRTASGGRVILLAPRVENQGRIESPEGQTILAAGAKVYLTAPLDTALRGFLVEVDPFIGTDAGGQAVNIGGTVVNQAGARYSERLDSGQVIERVYQIVAKRGNVTLAGLDVRQEGRILATSSVDQNGSIVIQARDTWTRNERRDVAGSEPVFIPKSNRTGTVVFATGSETSVLPETAAARSRPGDLGARAEIDILPATDNQRTLADDQRFNRSRIDVAGRSILVGSGARLLAPSGEVSFLAQAESARLDPAFLLLGPTDGQGVRVHLDSGAIVDVSGERNVAISTSRNVVEVDLRGSELKDSPVQRDGVLRGKKVYIDLRQTADITDVAPFRAQVQRTIAEKSTAGGSIQLKSEGDVVVGNHTRLDVSGGSIRYTDGTVGTTYLVGADGKLYDFMSAPKDIVYREVVNIANRLERGYTEGVDAGSIQLWGSKVVATGDMIGSTVAGEFQRMSGDLPQGGLLRIGDLQDDAGAIYSHLALTAQRSMLPAGFGLASPLPDTLSLWSGMFGRGGFTRLESHSLGALTLPAGVSLDVGPGGSIHIKAASADIGGSIRAAAGEITLAIAGDAHVASGAVLSAAGTWTNDRLGLATTAPVGAVATKGGQVRIEGGNLTLDAGSVVDVSAGAWLRADGSVRYGTPGSITLATGESRDNAGQQTPNQLLTRGTLLGYAVGPLDHPGTGGTLSIRTSRIAVGPARQSQPGEWLVQGGWFDIGGFSNFDLTGIDSVVFEPGANVAPVVRSRILAPGALAIATGSSMSAVASAPGTLLPAALRPPVTLAFATDRVDAGFGTIVLAAGANIDGGYGASIAFDAQNLIAVNGSIRATGGSITLALPTPNVGDTFDPSRMIWLGDEARLSTAGAVRVVPGLLPGPQGDVLAGGTIGIDAANGFVVARQGSRLDVSGSSAKLYVETARGQRYGLEEALVLSDAGSISLKAREGILYDGHLTGAPGGVGARGGSISVSIDRENRFFNPDSNPEIEERLQGARKLVVDGPVFGLAGRYGAGQAVDDLDLIGFAGISQSSIAAGEFDSITLASEHEVRFADAVTLRADRAISVEAPNIVAARPGTVRLEAAYVNLGPTRRDRQSESLRAPASLGDGGVLAVSAQHIDLTGAFSLGGIAATTLSASEDVRLRGVANSVVGGDDTTVELLGRLQSAGDVTVRSRQVYATTLSDFTFDLQAFGSGTLRFERTGAADVPVLSGAGAIRARAEIIQQFGVLKAPLGTIDLKAGSTLHVGTAEASGARGSITSVSGEGQIIPFGQTTLNGRQYVYTVDGLLRTIESIPEKNVILDAPIVKLDSGATIDISGGGDLLAWEFVPGPGGSTDVLDPANSPKLYAILPTLQSAFGPYDAQSHGSAAGLKPGDVISVGQSIPGLAEGTYTLLPARYGLLPGAFLVSIDDSTQDVLPRDVARGADGAWRVPGRLGSIGLDGTASSSRTIALDLAPGDWARGRSEYIETRAGTFFADGSERLPQDAGKLGVIAQTQLTLDAAVVAAVSGNARGGEVGIAAQKLAIVGNGATAESGFVEIDYRSLNRLGFDTRIDPKVGSRIDTLLIGGVRLSGAPGAIDVRADSIDVNLGNLAVGLSDDAARPLTADVIEFAATNRIDIREGSSIVADGGRTGTPAPVNIDGDGAYLRLSGGEQATLGRTGTTRSNGTLAIEEGTLLKAGAIIADATHETLIQGQLDFSAARPALGGAFAVGASRISLGAPPTDPGGVVLSQARLDALSGVRAIRLKSYSTIDLYGSVALDGNKVSTLEIDAAGIAGYANSGLTTRLSADRIDLSNQDGLVFADVVRSDIVHGAGLLAIDANHIGTSGRSTASRFETVGFATVEMTARDALVASGTSSLVVAGDLTLTAGTITATSSSVSSIEASGTLVTAGGDGTAPPASQEFGARMVLAGRELVHGGRVMLSSGELELRAGTGDLTLLSGSHTSVAGVQRTFADKSVSTPGGTVTLTSLLGDIDVRTGSFIDVSAPGAANAGHLIVAATRGSASLSGEFSGAAGSSNATQGSFQLDTGGLADTSTLLALLDAGRFHERVDLRVRTGDVVIDTGDTLKSRNVIIATDAGSVSISGTIDASGAKGGRVDVFARHAGTEGQGRVTLHETARILANAATSLAAPYGTDGEGGRVTLGVTGDTAEHWEQARVIVLAGSVIDVSVPDGSAARAGEVVFRVPRIAGAGGAPDVALTSNASGAASGSLSTGVVVGARSVVVEAFRVADFGSADVTIDAGLIAGWRDETRTFMTSAESILGRLGRASDSSFHLRPGFEIATSGSATLNSVWDLRLRSDGTSFDWRYGEQRDEPGVLSIRAGTDLAVNQSLSDGFSNALTTGRLQQTGEGWSYRLVAGADLGAANPMAVRTPGELGSSGNLTLAAGRLIRTSTGDIDIAAGGNLVLAAATSTIYTAGLADAPENHAFAAAPDRQFTNIAGLVMEYPFNGGDLRIKAGGDIHGAGGDQWVNDWLYRLGRLDDDGTFNSNTPPGGMRRPTWWPRFAQFRHGVGALGGGDVVIDAGGGIDNLGVVAATNGRLPGDQDSLPDLANLKVQGGGDVAVRAGGDINSSFFHAGRGDVAIDAAGALGSSRTSAGTPVYSVVSLGEGNLRVTANGDLRLESVLNATLAPQSQGNGATEDRRTFFTTYRSDSAADLVSLSGDVVLANNPAHLFSAFNMQPLAATETASLSLYPATVRAVALSGSVLVEGGMTLAPAASGQLELLAARSVVPNGTLNVSALDMRYLDQRLVDAATRRFDNGAYALPLISDPDNNFFVRIQPLAAAGYAGRTAHAATLTHLNDLEPIRIVALTGNVTGPDTVAFLQTPKSFVIEAGQDVTGAWIGGQNLRASDRSAIRAGRNIRFDVDRNGVPLSSSNAVVELGGPGTLELRAGGNVDLGPSRGIISRGNFNNAALPEGGAQLVVMAGTPAPDYLALFYRFTDPSAPRLSSAAVAAFNEALLQFMRDRTANPSLSLAAARPAFAALAPVDRAAFVATHDDLLTANEPALRDAFFVGVRDAGRVALETGDRSRYQEGFDIISTMFPTSPRSKDEAQQARASLSLFRSQIKTEQGGGIDLLVPGGFVNVGVTDAGASAKTASQLGIVTARGGEIRSVVTRNFDVNTSRVFTLQGGDIMIWSSYGNIDAGKGAKTASATPPPQIIVRGDQIILDSSNSISGSGIGVLLGREGLEADDVYLFAPTGDVNAGDAGIRVAGNLTIGAERVIGADNIRVGGVSTGVPALQSAGISGALPNVGSATSDATKAAEKIGERASTEANQNVRNLSPSFLTVEVIGLGDEDDERKRKR